MERERTHTSSQPISGGDSAPEHDLDQVRAKLDRLLAAADAVLDTLPAVAAEEYLQQSRQRGAE
jgi:hypothetical protein